MARRATSSAKKTLSRVTGAVKSTAKKVTAKLRPAKAKKISEAAAPKAKTTVTKPPAPRKRRLQSDVPIDSKSYTPTQTSLKGSFRTSGAERQRDQDSAAEERWNDEDRLTNKSGDPRIGTHGRTYEPGEATGTSKKGRK